MRALLLSLALSWVAFAAHAQQTTVTYTYDELGRLEKVDYGAGKTVDYDYDPAGNRTAQTVAGTGQSASNDGVNVIVLPISGFIVLPIRDPDCGLIAGCG